MPKPAPKAAQTFIKGWRWENHRKQPIRELIGFFAQHGIAVREFIRTKAKAVVVEKAETTIVAEPQPVEGTLPVVVIRRHNRLERHEPPTTLEWNAPDNRWWELTFPDGSVAYLIELWPMKAQMIRAEADMPDYIKDHLAKGRPIEEVWAFNPAHLTVVAE